VYDSESKFVIICVSRKAIENGSGLCCWQSVIIRTFDLNIFVVSFFNTSYGTRYSIFICSVTVVWLSGRQKLFEAK
jgi:hypothetical protein